MAVHVTHAPDMPDVGIAEFRALQERKPYLMQQLHMFAEMNDLYGTENVLVVDEATESVKIVPRELASQLKDLQLRQAFQTPLRPDGIVVCVISVNLSGMCFELARRPFARSN